MNPLIKKNKPIIGVIYLETMPGYPSHKGVDYIIKKAKKDCEILYELKFDGVLIENENDIPRGLLALIEAVRFD